MILPGQTVPVTKFSIIRHKAGPFGSHRGRCWPLAVRQLSGTALREQTFDRRPLGVSKML